VPALRDVYQAEKKGVTPRVAVSEPKPESVLDSAPPAKIKILRRGKIPYTVIDNSPLTILYSVNIHAISASNFTYECR
jgi:hypothetical protein